MATAYARRVCRSLRGLHGGKVRFRDGLWGRVRMGSYQMLGVSREARVRFRVYLKRSKITGAREPKGQWRGAKGHRRLEAWEAWQGDNAKGGARDRPKEKGGREKGMIWARRAHNG